MNLSLTWELLQLTIKSLFSDLDITIQETNEAKEAIKNFTKEQATEFCKSILVTSMTNPEKPLSSLEKWAWFYLKDKFRIRYKSFGINYKEVPKVLRFK